MFGFLRRASELKGEIKFQAEKVVHGSFTVEADVTFDQRPPGTVRVKFPKTWDGCIDDESVFDRLHWESKYHGLPWVDEVKGHRRAD